MIIESLISFLFNKISDFVLHGVWKAIEKKENMPETKGKTLYRYLTERNFQITNIPNDLNIDKGCVIWPIALQPSVTYIHTAQIQLINLLVKQGWNLHVIIGDCGKHSHSVKDSNPFKNSIIGLLKRHTSVKIKQQTVTLLGNYYQRNPKKKDKSLLQNITSLELLNTFHNISNNITWQTYWEYITKNYNTDIKGELQNRKILSNIQPLLIWALVITITKKYKKTIVVAGEDEKIQWDNIISRHGDNKIGIIYIPELKEGDKTMSQDKIGITSEQSMRIKLDTGNMAEWLYNHFIELPKFLSGNKPDCCHLSSNLCKDYSHNCIKCLFEKDRKNFESSDFNKDEFVTQIYEIANPANS